MDSISEIPNATEHRVRIKTEAYPHWTKGKSVFRGLDFPLCLSESRTVPSDSPVTDPIPGKLRRIGRKRKTEAPGKIPKCGGPILYRRNPFKGRRNQRKRTGRMEKTGTVGVSEKRRRTEEEGNPAGLLSQPRISPAAAGTSGNALCPVCPGKTACR